MRHYRIILLPFVAAVRLRRFLWDRVYYPLKTIVFKLAFGLDCDNSVRFVGKTIVRGYVRGSIKIGANTRFVSGTENNLVGLTNPCVICALPEAEITIGHDTGFSSVILHSKRCIQIGNYVKVGGNVRIFDHDFHPLEWDARRPPEDYTKTRARKVEIGNDVFIGTNALILKGTRIGDRSVVAAGSVVFGVDVPPDSLVKGNPATVVQRKVLEH